MLHFVPSHNCVEVQFLSRIEPGQALRYRTVNGFVPPLMGI